MKFSIFPLSYFSFELKKLTFLVLGMSATITSACLSKTQAPQPPTTGVAKEKKPRVDILKEYVEQAKSGGFKEHQVAEAFMIAESLGYSGKEKEAGVLYAAIFESSPTLTVGLKLARLYASQKNLESAEEVTKKLVVYYPKAPEPILALSYIETLKGLKKEARHLLERGVEIHPTSEDLALRFADLLIEEGLLIEAQSVLAKSTKRIPSSVPLLMRYAKLLLNAKKTKESKEKLSQLLLLDPQNIEAWALAGYLASEEGDDSAAENAFREASELAPDNEEITKFYLSQLLKSGKFQDAVRILKRMEATLDSTKQPDTEFYYQYGFALFQLEDYENAKQMFQKSIVNGGENSRSYFFLAQCFEQQKQSQFALEYYDKINPSSEIFPYSMQRKTFIAIDKGDFEGAKQLTQKFKSQFNSKDSDYRFVASIYARLRNYTEAQTVVQEGLTKFPKSQDLMYLKAAYKEYTVNKATSLAELESFIKLYPNNTQALNHLGYALAEAKQKLEFAINLLKKAIQLEPKNGFYLDSLGWAYFQSGKFKDAETYLIRALKLEPEEPVILEHLGELHFTLRNLATALKYFELADRLFKKKEPWNITMDPEWVNSHKKVQQRLQEIRKSSLPPS